MNICDNKIEKWRIKIERGKTVEPARIIAGGAKVRKKRGVNAGEIVVSDCIPARNDLGTEKKRKFQRNNKCYRECG